MIGTFLHILTVEVILRSIENRIKFDKSVESCSSSIFSKERIRTDACVQ